jgi:hypothetical protein
MSLYLVILHPKEKHKYTHVIVDVGIIYLFAPKKKYVNKLLCRTLMSCLRQ